MLHIYFYSLKRNSAFSWIVFFSDIENTSHRKKRLRFVGTLVDFLKFKQKIWYIKKNQNFFFLKIFSCIENSRNFFILDNWILVEIWKQSTGVPKKIATFSLCVESMCFFRDWKSMSFKSRFFWRTILSVV